MDLFQFPTIVDEEAFDVFFDSLVDVNENNIEISPFLKKEFCSLQIVFSPSKPFFNDFIFHKSPFLSWWFPLQNHLPFLAFLLILLAYKLVEMLECLDLDYISFF